VGSPTTIGVDDDLSSCETRVSLRSTNDEGARWVDNNLGVLKHLSWADLLEDLFSEHLRDLLVIDGGVVLSGDEDVVDTNWLNLSIFFLIFDNDL
jgi:hypothetical protein